MNKKNKGITLIELLAVLVLLGILTGLITTAVSIFIRSTNSSISASQIQTEGLLLVRTIESRVVTFGPEGYSSCDGDLTECIELINNTPSSPLILNTANNEVRINGSLIQINNLLVDSASISIEPGIDNNVVLTVTVVLTLDPSDGRTFTFRSSNLFRNTTP